MAPQFWNVLPADAQQALLQMLLLSSALGERPPTLLTDTDRLYCSPFIAHLGHFLNLFNGYCYYSLDTGSRRLEGHIAQKAG